MNIDGPDRDFEIEVRRQARVQEGEILREAGRGFRVMIRSVPAILIFGFCCVLPLLFELFQLEQVQYYSPMLDLTALAIWIGFVRMQFQRAHSSRLKDLHGEIARRRFRVDGNFRLSNNIVNYVAIFCILIIFGIVRSQIWNADGYEPYYVESASRRFILCLSRAAIFMPLRAALTLGSPLRAYCDNPLILTYPRWLLYHQTLRHPARSPEVTFAFCALLFAGAGTVWPAARFALEQGTFLFIAGLAHWRILQKDIAYLGDCLLPDSRLTDVFN